jgi:hypothetical protein
MKRVTKGFQDLMAAITFAEAGELETARAILKERERVLLALREGHIEASTLRYALNTCKRIGADLDILYLPAADVITPELSGFLQELERTGIPHRLVKASGCLQQAVMDYVNARTGIAFAVIDGADDPETEGKLGKLSRWWEKVKCPLVIVTNRAEARG